MFLVSLQEKVIAMKEEKKGASWDVSAQSGYMFVTFISGGGGDGGGVTSQEVSTFVSVIPLHIFYEDPETVSSRICEGTKLTSSQSVCISANKNSCFQRDLGTFSAVFAATKTRSLPNPNQMVFVPKPNQSISIVKR